jgi:hypothetical protein
MVRAVVIVQAPGNIPITVNSLWLGGSQGHFEGGTNYTMPTSTSGTRFAITDPAYRCNTGANGLYNAHAVVTAGANPQHDLQTASGAGSLVCSATSGPLP